MPSPIDSKPISTRLPFEALTPLLAAHSTSTLTLPLDRLESLKGHSSEDELYSARKAKPQLAAPHYVVQTQVYRELDRLLVEALQEQLKSHQKGALLHLEQAQSQLHQNQQLQKEIRKNQEDFHHKTGVANVLGTFVTYITVVQVVSVIAIASLTFVTGGTAAIIAYGFQASMILVRSLGETAKAVMQRQIKTLGNQMSQSQEMRALNTEMMAIDTQSFAQIAHYETNAWKRLSEIAKQQIQIIRSLTRG